MTGREAGDMPLSGASVLVTGATGKLGQALVPALLEDGARVSVLTRERAKAEQYWPGNDITVRVGDLIAPETLVSALDGIEAVFHLASHSPGPDAADLYEDAGHWAISAVGTWHLVGAARRQQVSRLIYVSSVMAMGSGTPTAEQPANEQTPCAPDTLYGRAKREAECAVLSLGASFPADIHTCVIRLPMVYGLDGAGNLQHLVAAVARGRFPPWPRHRNRRTAVHCADAVSAMRLAGTRRHAAGKVYLVTDGNAYSTRWMYEEACRALGRPAPDWAVPFWTLRSAAGLGDALQRLTGRAPPLSSTQLRKLLGDAWYSSDRIRADLDFRPRYAMAGEIARLAAQHLAKPRR